MAILLLIYDFQLLKNIITVPLNKKNEKKANGTKINVDLKEKYAITKLIASSVFPETVIIIQFQKNSVTIIRVFRLSFSLFLSLYI